MLGNKICVTEKGLDFLVDHKAQFQNERKYSHSRTSSLPSIKSLELSKCQTITHKQVQNQSLSLLSKKLALLQKVGIRKLIIKKQDAELTKMLKIELRGKQQYLSTLIPQIVRKTRDPRKTDNIDSRFHRSRAYTQRLLQNYKSQQKFGISNHRQHRNNEEQDSRQRKNSKN